MHICTMYRPIEISQKSTLGPMLLILFVNVIIKNHDRIIVTKLCL